MAIALVNTTSGFNDASGGALGATAANHTAGNLIVVGVIWQNAGINANVPTDTALNTYVSTGQKATSGADFTEIFYAKNISGNAANVVTANFTGNALFRRVLVHQYSGCDTVAPFATGEGGTGTVAAGTVVTSSSWATAIADEVFVAFAGTNNGFVMTAGIGYGKELNLIGADSTSEDRIVSATNTYTASFSWTGNQDAWLAAASFSATASSTPYVRPKIIVSREAQKRASRW